MKSAFAQFALVVAAVSVPVISAVADTPFAYEGFNYGPSANLQGANGGTGWGGGWFKLSQIPTGVASGGLTWPGLQTSGNSAFTAPYASADFTRYSRALATYSDPDDVIYISFLVRPNIGFGVNGGLAFGTWENGMVMGTRPSGYYGLMTPPNTASSDSHVQVVEGETALLVARIAKNLDSTVTWSLFVNPTVRTAEPVEPDASLIVAGTVLPPAIFIYNDGGFSTDEIRVGPTWDSVLPADIVAGDVNGDGFVNVIDLLAVINTWGACPAPPTVCHADLNGDGFVNVADLLTVINNWG